MSTPDDRTTIEVRHHQVLLLRRCWPAGLLMFLAALAAVAIATAGVAPGGGAADWLPRVLLAAFLGGGVRAGWCYLEWSYDALYLTERRLIERAGIPRISEARRELLLERVQSVEVKQGSLLARWCGCGDLIVDIAGAGLLRFAAAREVFPLRERILARLETRRQAGHAVGEAEVRATVRQLLGPDDPEAQPDAPPAAPVAAEAGPARLWRPRGGPTRRPRRPRFGRRFAGIAWRRHAWFLVRGAVAPAALAALALLLPFLLDTLRLAALLPLAGPLALGTLLAAGVWFAWLWADWRNDHYVVTPDQLLEIEQLPFGLRQQVSSAALDRVQDIRYRVPHPLAALLDYGDVAVHTAGETTPFVFRGIARPRELAATIDRHVTAFRLAEEAARREALREEFARWLIAYEELRGPSAGYSVRPADDPEGFEPRPAPGRPQPSA